MMLVEGSIRRARTDWPSGGIARRNAHPHYFTYDSPPSNEEETRRFRRCRDVYQPAIADDLEGRRCVFLAGLYRTEREIAERLKALAIGRPPWSAIDADKGIPWVEQRTRLALADSQREAIRGALVSKVLVITGGPGVGKTTLVDSILKILLHREQTPGSTLAAHSLPHRRN